MGETERAILGDAIALVAEDGEKRIMIRLVSGGVMTGRPGDILHEPHEVMAEIEREWASVYESDKPIQKIVVFLTP